MFIQAEMEAMADISEKNYVNCIVVVVTVA